MKSPLESVEHGWSLAGYYYVRIQTGANGPHGDQLICVDQNQARRIAEALHPLLRPGSDEHDESDT
jgi:hypothetical protein